MSNPQARRYARKRAVQALYQWQLNPMPSVEIIAEFYASQQMERADTDYFQQLLNDTIRQVEELDENIRPYVDIPLEKLDPVEHAILRIAMYELTARLDIPCRVILNEAIDLAKTYGGEQGHKFINGALDKAARQYRTLEIQPSN